MRARGAAALVSIALMCGGSGVAKAGSLSLGAAGGYAVFALDEFDFNGPGTVNGNVAIGQVGNLNTPAVINGTVYVNNGATVNGNVVPTGGFVTTDLTTAISDAQSAAVTFSGLTATQTLGNLGNNSQINGTGGVNVVDVSSIKMTNGTLTLNGSANDIFIINDTGGFTSSNSDMVLTGGVTANHILFNISGSVQITGGGPVNFYGTFLDPLGEIDVHDKVLNGELIANVIKDTSGFTVNNVSFSTVPEPSTCAIAGLGLLALAGIARRRRAKS